MYRRRALGADEFCDDDDDDDDDDDARSQLSSHDHDYPHHYPVERGRTMTTG